MYYKPLELKLLSSKIQKENTSAQEKNKKKKFKYDNWRQVICFKYLEKVDWLPVSLMQTIL